MHLSNSICPLHLNNKQRHSDLNNMCCRLPRYTLRVLATHLPVLHRKDFQQLPCLFHFPFELEHFVPCNRLLPHSDRNKPLVRFHLRCKPVRSRQDNTDSRLRLNNTCSRSRPYSRLLPPRSDQNKQLVRFHQPYKPVRSRQDNTDSRLHLNNMCSRSRPCNPPPRSDQNKPLVRFHLRYTPARFRRHNTDSRLDPNNKCSRSRPCNPPPRSDQNKQPARFHLRYKPARFRRHNTDSRSDPNNTDCRLRPYSSKPRNFRRRHIRKAPDLPADNRNKPVLLHNLPYPDNYSFRPNYPYWSNLFVRWKRWHNHTPNYRPNHTPLHRKPAATT